MKCEIKKKVLKSFLDSLSPLLDEARIEFSKDGMRVRAVDPAQVAMVEATVKDSGFEEYSSEKKEQIGVVVRKLLDVLKVSDEAIDMETSNGFLLIKSGYLSRKMRMIDVVGPDTKTPDLSYEVGYDIGSDDMKRALKAAGTVKNDIGSITLKASKDGFMFQAESDNDSMSMKIRRKENDGLEKFAGDWVAKSMFSVEYLEKICKHIPGKVIVHLSISNDMPLKIEYSDSNGDNEGNLRVSYLLAPRIEDM